MDGRQTIIGERRTYTDVGDRHHHPFAQLILPLQGSLFIETPVRQLHLDESAVFFIPPGCWHHFYACATNEFLTLDIPAHLVSDIASRETEQGIRTEFSDRWRALRSLLLIDLTVPQSPPNALLYLVQYMRELLTATPRSRSQQYLHQHYHQAISVAHLAQLEGYSPSYYSEWFKAQTGRSPKDYQQDLRLQQAKHLLGHTDLPIYRIAQAVGFARASSLTRLFQQRDRTTPQQYRLDNQNPAN